MHLHWKLIILICTVDLIAKCCIGNTCIHTYWLTKSKAWILLNYMKHCNSAFCKGPIVCASFLSSSHNPVGRTEVKMECGHTLFALCNKHGSDTSQMKKDKGEAKKGLICKYFKVFHPEISEKKIFMNKIFSSIFSCVYSVMKM